MVAVTLVTTFLLMQTADELTPRGTRTILTVWDTRTDLTTAEIRTALLEGAERANVTLVKVYEVVDGSGTRRVLSPVHVAAGNSFGGARGDYQDFRGEGSTSWRAFSEVPDAELTGMYVTDATTADAQDLRRWLANHGVTSELTAVTWLTAPLWLMGEAPIGVLLFAAVLGAGAGVVHWSASRIRADAVRQANGERRLSSSLRACTTIVVLTFSSSIVGVSLAAVPLWFHNGLAQFDRFAGVSLFGAACVAVGLAGIAMISSGLAHRATITQRLDGLRPERSIATVTVSCALLVSTLLISVTSTTVDVGLTAELQGTERDAWKRTANLASMTFRMNEQQFQETRESFAALYERERADGHVLIAAHPAGPRVGHDPWTGNSMIVNARFLREQKIERANGHRVEPGRLDPRALTLLVPAVLMRQRASLVNDFDEWARFENSGQSDHPSPDDAVPIRVIETRSNERVFNYGVGASDPTSTQVDPVIAVLPSSTRIVSNDWIVSTMTSAGVMFDDPRELRSSVDAAGLGRYIGPIETMRDQAAIRLRHDEERTTTSIAIGMLALVAGSIAVMVLASATAHRRRRADFLRFVNGRRLIALQSTVVVASIGVALLMALALAGFVSGPAELMASTGTVLATVATVSVLLEVQRARLRTERVHCD
jgi:hypothetical protein